MVFTDVQNTTNGDCELDEGNINEGDCELEEENMNEDANRHKEFNSDLAMEYDFDFYVIKGSLSNRYKFRMDEPVSVPSTTLNVLVSWPEKLKEDYDTSLPSYLPEVCKLAVFSKSPQESIPLYNCLDAFLKEEPLGPEDMWYCPICKTHQQASKKLDLWRLPEILVIHLKRFSYNRFFKNKLETLVDFLIDNFDLSSYMVHQRSTISHRYMLYTVSNHYGGMDSGHYTAFVRHGQSRWFEFDDSAVSHIREEEIKTSSAYVLFYRRIPDTVHNTLE